MRYFFLLFTGIFYLSFASLSLAAVSEFPIRMIINDDTTPPTTPVLLSAVPLGSSQIDIAWQASTDNVLLGGYVVLRDGAAIATTTLTSFSDTGLAASTLYTYELFAFDSASNISSTSNALGTSTLAAPILPPVSAAGGPASQSTQTIILQDFVLETMTTEAKFTWQTNVPSRFVLRWGRYDTYLDGYVMSEIFRSNQSTTITGLAPGVTYYYELVGFTPANRPLVLRAGQFTTEEVSAPLAIPNVSRLTGEVEGVDVRLSYVIPQEPRGLKVRILRNHLGFPTDMFDGAVVYEGTKLEVLDKGALLAYSPQYYTVFVVGEGGRNSSGAVVVMEKMSTSLPAVSTPGGDEGVPGTGEIKNPRPIIPLPGTILLPPITVFGLESSAILLTQGSLVATFLTPDLSLAFDLPFTLEIARSAVPDYLKAIIVTLTDPQDEGQQYSFLLRSNALNTAYTATILPLNLLGTSRLQVEIFDFERSIIGRYVTSVTFVSAPKPAEVFFPDAIFRAWPQVSVVLFGFFVLGSFWWFILWRRRRKTEDNA